MTADKEVAQSIDAIDESHYEEYFQRAKLSNIPVSFYGAYRLQLKNIKSFLKTTEPDPRIYFALTNKLLGKVFTLPILNIPNAGLNRLALDYCFCIADIKKFLESERIRQHIDTKFKLLLSPLAEIIECDDEEVLSYILQSDFARDPEYNETICQLQQIVAEKENKQRIAKIFEQKIIQEINTTEYNKKHTLPAVPKSLKEKYLSEVIIYIEQYFTDPKNVNRLMLLGVSKKFA